MAAREREDNRNNQLPLWERLAELDSGYDLDLLRDPGLYIAYQPTNGPLAATDVFVQVLSGNVGGFHRTMQRAYQTVSGLSYTRVRGVNGWVEWNHDNPSSQTEVLTSNRTYYLRSDGSDNNNGQANTAAGAFLTLQKALDAVQALDLNYNTVTIQLGTTGSFGNGLLNGLKNPRPGTNNLTINGNVTNAGYIIGALTLRHAAEGTVSISGVQATSISVSRGQAVINSTVTLLSNTTPLTLTNGAKVTASFEHAPTTPATCASLVDVTSSDLALSAVTLTGTPNYSIAVINYSGTATAPAVVTLPTFTGSATGKQFRRTGVRARLQKNAVMSVNTTTRTLWTGVPGDAPPNTIGGTTPNLVVRGNFQGALTAKDYDLVFALGTNARLISFEGRTKSGSAICQVRQGGTAGAQGTAIGTTGTVGTGSVTVISSIADIVVGANDGLTLTISDTPTAVDLFWQLNFYDEVAYTP